MRRPRSGVLRLLAPALALVLMTACNPDPTGGARPPARGAAVPAYTSGQWPVERDDVALSWRPGCPVHWSDLTNVLVSYWGYDGRRHTGTLVVHDSVATDIRAVFRHLYDFRVQIRRIHPIEVYGADDDRSMANNNTSAFNCRPVAGTSSWSEHSYGTAIDINPVQNPWVRGSAVAPPAGRDWLDRSSVVPGMITRDDEVWRAFTWIGWSWGGDWSSTKDYQHFSRSGR